MVDRLGPRPYGGTDDPEDIPIGLDRRLRPPSSPSTSSARPRLGSALTLAVGCVALSLAPGGGGSEAGATGHAPDIVVVMTDDQRWDTIASCLPAPGLPGGEPSGACPMPNLREHLVGPGVAFTQAFTTTAICCPARASFLTGTHAHTTQVLTNSKPDGGYSAFRPLEPSALPVWLDRAGYRTGLFGKYMNDYGRCASPPCRVPVGWDEWHAEISSSDTLYRGYTLNDNGSINDYPSSYFTTHLGQLTRNFILQAPADQPLFAFYAPVAPHHPATPAEGDGAAFGSMPPWRPAAYNEADVSDKPSWVRQLPRLGEAGRAPRDAFYRDQMESLLEVDRQIGRIVQALQATGRLANTLIVFTSDNGLSWGEHRYFSKKSCPYEECHRVPMVVRYDPRTAGLADAKRLDPDPVLTIDLAPTIAEAAGLSDTPAMEGRSLLRLLGGAQLVDWRTAMLGEDFGFRLKVGGEYVTIPVLRYIRTFPGDPLGGQWKYVELRSDPPATELYDELGDRAELASRHVDPQLGQVRSTLAGRLDALAAAVPPRLALSGPAPLTSSDSATVAVSGPSEVSRLRCWLDGARWSPCTRSNHLDGLGEGIHRFTVIGDGTPGTSAATGLSWTVDATAPAAPTLIQVPPDPSGEDVSFRFTAEAGAALSCNLDGTGFRPCSSPTSYAGLAGGPHVFSVLARDGAGNTSPARSYRWTVESEPVDDRPPQVSLVAPSPDTLLLSRVAELRWTYADPPPSSGAGTFSVEERLGLGGTFRPVVATAGTKATRSGLARGTTYCWRIRGRDPAGNEATSGVSCAAVPLDDRSLSYEGEVSRVASAKAFDGTLTILGPGSQVSYPFTGRKVGILLQRGPEAGKVRIFLDGALAKTVDLYRSTPASFHAWAQAFGEVGPHTVRVAWTGLKNASSSGTDVPVDGITVIGP
jgi:N-acetylglucosamine-6-sulfatase